MDFTPLIVLGSISLLVFAISSFLCAFTYFNKSRIAIIDNKHISYDGGIYEKKN